MIVSTGGGTLDDVRARVRLRRARSTRRSRSCSAPPATRSSWEELDLRVIDTYRAALPGRGRRLLRPRQRDRDAGRRLRARRPDRREALHAQPRGEGHRPPLLARAGRACASWSATSSARALALGDGDKIAVLRARPTRSPRWARRSSPRATLPAGHVLRARGSGAEVAGGRRPPAVRARPVIGRTLRHPVAEDSALTFERPRRGAADAPEPAAAPRHDA